MSLTFRIVQTSSKRPQRSKMKSATWTFSSTMLASCAASHFGIWMKKSSKTLTQWTFSRIIGYVSILCFQSRLPIKQNLHFPLNALPQTAKAFLPEMMESNRGHIVTVASVAGLLGTYGCTDYSATKFACVGFHEALFTELRTHGYDDIHMTLVCPYYIASGMFAGVKPRMFPMLTPKYVADQITLSVQKNEVNCTMPHSLRMLLPLKWWAHLRWLLAGHERF